jgi:RNA polymerase sigma factor (sigma-70 family)
MTQAAEAALGLTPILATSARDSGFEALFQQKDNPGGYLRRCVVNRANDRLRRRRLERRFHLLRHETNQDLGADEMTDALATLSPRRRTVVVLRYYAGLREREIAEVLGIRPGAVKSLLHRALAQLREAIER